MNKAVQTKYEKIDSNHFTATVYMSNGYAVIGSGSTKTIAKRNAVKFGGVAFSWA